MMTWSEVLRKQADVRDDHLKQAQEIADTLNGSNTYPVFLCLVNLLFAANQQLGMIAELLAKGDARAQNAVRAQDDE